MKAVLLILALQLMTNRAYSQGCQFRFTNRDALSGVNSPVFHPFTCAPLSGPAFVAQLYVGQTPDNLLAYAGTRTTFQTGSSAGYWTPVIVNLTTVPLPGQPLSVQARVWEAVFPTFEEAQANGGLTITSGIHAWRCGDAPPRWVFAQCPPLIVAGPTNQSVFAGATARFNVTATGSPPLSYRWRFNGTSLSDNVSISGSSTAALTINEAYGAHAGGYSVVIGNSVGSVTSQVATLTVITCSFAITPVDRLHGPTAEQGTIAVTASNGCSWSATSHVAWISIASGSSGTGDGVVTYAVAANAEVTARTGTLSVAGQTFTVTQVANAPSLLDTWYWRNPLPQGHDLSAVAYGNGIFVAVGECGTIMASSDGASWALRTSGTNDDLLGIAYLNGIFVAVGFSGTILRSNNGTDWSYDGTDWCCQGAQGIGLRDIAYGGGLYVTVSEFGDIWTSPNARNWTYRDSGTFWPLYGISYGNGNFVAVGENGTILSSSDAVHWTQRSSGTTELLEDVTYGDGEFVVVGREGTILTSPNAQSWTANELGSGFWFQGIAYGDGRFVAVDFKGGALTSLDGMTWMTHSLGITELVKVAYGNGTFVAVGDKGKVRTSPTGSTWTARDAGARSNLKAVAYSGNTFVAVGETDSLGVRPNALTSTDGIEWAAPSELPSGDLYGVAYGAGMFAAVGYYQAISISADGRNWSSITPAPDWPRQFEGVAYGGGKFAAVGGGTIVTATDPQNWTEVTSVGAGPLYGIAYGSGTFVAAGGDDFPGFNEGVIIISTNGTEWIQRGRVAAYPLYGVAYGNGTFVAVGGRGIVVTSTDGVVWTSRSSGTSQRLSAVTYSPDAFLAVGDLGVILTSPDGINWTDRNSGTCRYLTGVAYGKGTFVVVGDTGAILQSGSFAPARLMARSVSTSQGFELTIFGEIGRTYRLQGATNLGNSNWGDLVRFTLAQGSTNILDSTATNFSTRFYRAVSP
jgi:hypothetical protein